MDTTLMNNDNQQLIQMSALSSEKYSKENHNDRIYEINNSKDNESKISQQTYFKRLFSWPIQLLRSLHKPCFSDRSLRQIFLLLITFIGVTSFTIALIVGSSTVQFKQQCPLYASFKFETLSTTISNWTIKIVPASEKFSSQSTCDFCTFFNVCTFIYCIMTGFFFVLFNGDQSVVATNDRYLIIPWFTMSVILGVLALINASVLTNGFSKFCTTITTNNRHITSCTQLNQIHFEQYPNVSLFFLYMLVAIIESWFQLAFFIGVITILTIRLSSLFE
ncbi:unnamed protein product [Rotaria magnacalcarata]|uniref:Transmembrane protein n=1 Tax=Rotaria magnacalcarata TaxID=392030 RepID=A0A819JVJ8_9BILA|nr:unnamed protein product [Rotaria magnacalcarata]CAF1625791.1 unnamed protein product [Rotaria magnacalcarata]CAF2037847.1 unnamed protein product [Rotaria magnacalcarata]CAF2066409.1 unnamed protein product [Rotaria magnacalcarata]CAF2123780.1 unnamed protein product [Rotaria magnacalcarata]